VRERTSERMSFKAIRLRPNLRLIRVTVDDTDRLDRTRNVECLFLIYPTARKVSLLNSYFDDKRSKGNRVSSTTLKSDPLVGQPFRHIDIQRGLKKS